MKVTWCFTPSQPVRLYQGEEEEEEEESKKHATPTPPHPSTTTPQVNKMNTVSVRALLLCNGKKHAMCR